MGSGPGRWLCSLTTPGSVEVPSSPRTTSWPPLTASMAPATTTSWPEPTTSESPPNPTELKSPHLTDGTTHNGTPTPSPTTLPSSTTSSPAVFHPSETPPIPMSSSPPPDGENPPITPEESPPYSECNAIYGIVGDGVVCIDTTGGKGTCNGDSGGPLNMKFDVKDGAAGQKWKQIGVVSFGASAGCEVGYPAGFSRTEYYRDWLCSETDAC